jgi:hypothetical protein
VRGEAVGTSLEIKTDQRTLEAIRVLDRVVAMIPRTPVLRCLENIRHVVLGRNRALSHSIYTIHVRGLMLSDAVPMYTCTVVCHVIDNCHVDGL